MKKELLILLQFILIASAVSFIAFRKLVFEVSDFASPEVFILYKFLYINWTLMFVILGFIRLPIASLLSYLRAQNLYAISKKSLFRDNALRTTQYLILAVIAVLTPMWIIALRPDDDLDIERINIFDLWWSFRQDVLFWLGLFFVLSSIRLCVVFIREKSRNKIQ